MPDCDLVHKCDTFAVDMIEKAAAKLFGCYSALNSGTFGEALGLLTGYSRHCIVFVCHATCCYSVDCFVIHRTTHRRLALGFYLCKKYNYSYPVETMRLYEPKSVKEARAKRRTQIQQLKMAALFRGEQPPEDDQDEVDALDDNLQNDVMWTRLWIAKSFLHL